MPKNRKKLSDKLNNFYIKNIKKWMFCPVCKKGKMIIDKKLNLWICEDCNYQLSNKEFENNYVFWFCDECESYLNNQDGFDITSNKHICRNCGYENDTTENNIKGCCSDCGKLISNPEATICVDCRNIRKKKAKDWLIKAGIVVGAAALAIGVASSTKNTVHCDADCTNEFDNDDKENEVYGLGNDKYPLCKTCQTLMTEFDGWAWYTCPQCGDSVRIIDGKEKWHDELFKEGKKQHYSDFELADFCRGGDLTED